MAAGTAERKTRPGVEEQRRAILSAAVALFSAHGSATVSVSAICQQAQVSRDTFYRCYTNKDALIDALYSESISANMLAVTASPEADFGDPAWLQQTVDQVVDEILKEHQVARFLFLESADPESRAYQVIDRAFDEVAGLMQDWCRKQYGDSPGRGPGRGCFKGLLSASQWLVQEAIHRGRTPQQVRAAKQSIEELFLAVFRGLS